MKFFFFAKVNLYILIDIRFQIAKDIKECYEMFDGFVVLHGTDTLAYTASALSFMLENLGKPVIVTGYNLIDVKTTTFPVLTFVILLL